MGSRNSEMMKKPLLCFQSGGEAFYTRLKSDCGNNTGHAVYGIEHILAFNRTTKSNDSSIIGRSFMELRLNLQIHNGHVLILAMTKDLIQGVLFVI